MIFSNKIPIAVYIRKNSLEFYIESDQKHLEFPADAISDGDIINAEKYEKIVTEFLAAENIKKQQVILILAEEILFRKTLPAEEVKLLDERLSDFVSMIPIESGKLTKKAIELENNIELFAANKDLFEKLIGILDRSGFEVSAVVPLSPYSTDNELTQDVIKKVYQDKQFLKKTNFLSEGLTNISSSSGKNNLAVITLLIIIIIILSFILAGIYFKLPLPFLNKETELAKIELKTSPNPIASESVSTEPATTSAFLSADQLSVSIFNGTGIAGQAGKIKDLLIPLGLIEIETANAEGAQAKDTVVVFSSSVDDDLKEKITVLLNNSFESVSTQENTSSSSADILITTGKPK